jgi:hypothetical protein
MLEHILGRPAALVLNMQTHQRFPAFPIVYHLAINQGKS